MYAYICPDCGAYLDPGEICDCREKEKAAPDGANTEGGMEKTTTYIISKTEEMSMNNIGIDPDYDFLYDPQQRPPAGWCPVCGGEIYGEGQELCDNCAEARELERLP